MKIICTKVTYFSREGADKAIERIKARAKKSKCMRKYKPKRSYQCPRCNFWHLTSQAAR